MLRSEIIKWGNKIVTDLVEHDVVSLLRSLVQSSRSDKTESIDIEKVISYQISVHNYPSAAIHMMNILEIGGLLEAKFWQRAVVRTEAADSFAHNNFIAANNAIEFLPHFISLLKRGEYKKNEEKEEESNEGFVEVILIEDDNDETSAEKIANLMISVDGIYKAICDIRSYEGQGINVRSIDSGSDKSFDFFGLAACIKEIRKIIFGIWDRKRMAHHENTVGHTRLVAESLPIFAEISDLEKKKKLSSEEAKRLRNRLIKSIGLFIDTGAYIPDMVDISDTPRLLMRSDTKLLESSSSENGSEEKSKNRSSAKKKKKKRPGSKK